MCGSLFHGDRFIVLRSLYLGLVFLPHGNGNLFGKSSPCIKELTNANAGLDNVLTREEFYKAWAPLANHWCSATTSAPDDNLFDDLCCSCMEYDVGQFDAWCCMKVTFADSWVGVRIPDDMYPREYAESICDRIENRIRELYCTEDDNLSPEASPPSKSSSTRPTVSPAPSAGNDQSTTSAQRENGFMNELGEGMILALCAFLLILLLGGTYVWLSSRNSHWSDVDDDSRESATKSLQSGNVRAAPIAEQPDPFNDFRKGNPIEDNIYFPKEASPRRSHVERVNEMPNNSRGGQGAPRSDLSVDSEEEPQFFL